MAENQLTFESDDNRQAKRVASIIDGNGRRIVFYEKEFASGLLTGGIVSDAGGLNIDVEAGTGNLNSTPASWPQVLSLAVQPSKLQLVGYNLNTTQIEVIDDFDMNVMNNVIYLAFIFAGTTSIVRISNISATGKYIFLRRQIDQGGGNYQFENTESIMNSGQSPSAFYDSVSGRIYMTYVKNSMVFQRIIEVGNESSAWNYILDTDLQGGVLVLNEKIINESLVDAGASKGFYSTRFSYNFEVVKGNISSNPTTHTFYFKPPRMNLSFNVEFYEIYKDVAGTQVLQESIVYDPFADLIDMSSSYTGEIFLGARGKRIDGQPASIDSDNRLLINVTNDVVLDYSDNQHSAFFNELDPINVSASMGMDNITSTLTQVNTIIEEELDISNVDASGSNGISLITSTMTQVNTIVNEEFDNTSQVDVSSSNGIYAITT